MSEEKRVRDLELTSVDHEGRIDRLEGDQKKGSERMGKVETRVKTLEDWRLYSTAWVIGAVMAGTFLVGLAARALGW